MHFLHNTRPIREVPPIDPVGPWLIALDFLPPSVNHSHHNLQGRRALTEAACNARDAIAAETQLAAFSPAVGLFYAVAIVFTFPTWAHDIDGPIKPLLDAVFGPRWDHRIVRLEVAKLVRRQEYAALVRIERCGEDGGRTA